VRTVGSGRVRRATPSKRVSTPSFRLHSLEFLYPLYRERNAITPLSWIADQSIENTSCYELPDYEAHVGIRGQVDTERHRQDFGCIGRCNSCEYTPWKPAEDFACREKRRKGQFESATESSINHLPARSTPTLGARKVMKMKAARMTSEARMTLFIPNREVNIPFRRTPKNAPTPEALLRPDCHAAVS